MYHFVCVGNPASRIDDSIEDGPIFRADISISGTFANNSHLTPHLAILQASPGVPANHSPPSLPRTRPGGITTLRVVNAKDSTNCSSSGALFIAYGPNQSSRRSLLLFALIVWATKSTSTLPRISLTSC